MQINRDNFYIVAPYQFVIARKLLRIRQNDVADAVDLTPINYSKIEREVSEPKLSTYKTIVEYFIRKGITFHSNGNVTIAKEEFDSLVPKNE